MAAPLPRQFGAYVLQRRLGVGGMAETFVARRDGEEGLTQLVCLKRVLPAFNEDADFVKQFQREARIAGRLRHNNIVGILDYGEVQGEQFMALELVDGVDLRGLLGSLPERRLDPEVAALVALDLAYALDYAHEAQGGIIHRDVTPSNVLLSTHGEVKLADFGVAKAMTGATVATATGFVKGKVPYMAPEQMRGGDIDGRVDLFALGVTLYESLAGRRPFVGQHDVEVMMKVLEGRRPPLAELAPDLPEALVALVENLLESGADDRPPTAGDVIDALAGAIGNASRARDRLAALVKEAYGAPKPEGAQDTDLALEPELPAADPAPDPLAATAMAPSAIRPTPPRLAEVEAPPAPAPSRRRGVILGFVVALLVGGGALAVGLASGDPEPAANLEPETEVPAPEPVATEPSVEPAIPSGEATPAAPPEEPTMEDRPSRPSRRVTVTMDAVVPPTEMTEMAPVMVEAPAMVEAVEMRAEPREPMRTTRMESLVDVHVTVVPFGSVWVGNRRMSSPRFQLPPGRHVIWGGRGEREKQETIVLRDGQGRREVRIDLPD
ncbi:MAG: protein kinase [Myxococcota bacterium]